MRTTGRASRDAYNIYPYLAPFLRPVSLPMETPLVTIKYQLCHNTTGIVFADQPKGSGRNR